MAESEIFGGKHHHLVAIHGKGGIKYLAKVRGKEMTNEQIGKLNILKLKQLYLTTKVCENFQLFLAELTLTNLLISRWYSNESSKSTLMSRSDDLNLSKKVCI